MSMIRSVLVHFDASEDAGLRLGVAAEFAARFDAEVTVLYAVVPATTLGGPDWSGTSTPWLADYDAQRRKEARARFEKAQTKSGVRMHWQESSDVFPAEGTVRAAHVHDLVVLGQRRPGVRWPGEIPSDFVPAVVIGSGAPALVVPHSVPCAGFGRAPMVAWKPTREAARAVRAALPLLQVARTVTVCGWGAAAAASADGLSQWLLRHGVESRMEVSAEPEPEAVGELLLSRASDVGADLLITGCYGHARVREWVMGGASRTLLESMTLPLLAAH
jgi:nucleotide-binding universal stress UspA family protein